MIGTFVHPRGEDRWRDCIRFYHRSLSTDVNTTRFSSNWTESNDLIEILLKRNTYTQPSFPPTSLSLHPVSSQRCDLSRHLSRVSRVTVSRVGEKELEFAEEIFHTRERKKFRLFSGEKKGRREGTRCFHSRLCVCVCGRTTRGVSHSLPLISPACQLPEATTSSSSYNTFHSGQRFSCLLLDARATPPRIGAPIILTRLTRFWY